MPRRVFCGFFLVHQLGTTHNLIELIVLHFLPTFWCLKTYASVWNILLNSWRVSDKNPFAFCKLLFLSLITHSKKKHLLLLITIFFSLPYSLYVFWKYLGLCCYIFLIFFIRMNKTC
jgi:hypothetical protein